MRAPAALAAVDDLQEVAADIRRQRPELHIYFDLAELRGYHYHTGIVFAAYVPGHGQALANGGRYNGVGEVFGRARPATGFATDLKGPAGLAARWLPKGRARSACPIAITRSRGRWLRATGEIVINTLRGKRGRCDRELVINGLASKSI